VYLNTFSNTLQNTGLSDSLFEKTAVDEGKWWHIVCCAVMPNCWNWHRTWI